MVRDGTRLKLNGSPFRFSGANVFWLALDESYPTTPTVDYPSTFRVDDALDTVVEMGGTVVRTFAALSVGDAKAIQSSLGTFNETALTKLDYAVKACKDRGLRLILPLVDSASPSSPFYIGGTKTYTDWRSLANSDSFWTDATVIADFELHISTILNRVNTLTGVAYKDEPAIMAWETSNEGHTIGNAFPTTAWTSTIASYIKSLDRKHLLIDGEYVGVSVNTAALQIGPIDIFSNHQYPMNVSNMNNDIFRVTTNNKAFYVGEFQWNSTSPDSLSTYVAAIEAGSIVGDQLWNLQPHRDDKGYLAHGADTYQLYYPGLETTPGQTGMRAKAQTLRTHGFAMQGVTTPANGIPKTPLITSVTGGVGAAAISWRGAAIADTYTVERATAGSGGPFTVVGTGITDQQTPWTDSTAPSGNVWYRVKGLNLSSVAGPYSPVFATTL